LYLKRLTGLLIGLLSLLRISIRGFCLFLDVLWIVSFRFLRPEKTRVLARQRNSLSAHRAVVQICLNILKGGAEKPISQE